MKKNLAVNKIDTGEFKILLFDIETTPHTSYTWGKYDQNVIAFKEYGDLLCYSYKWLGEESSLSNYRPAPLFILNKDWFSSTPF